jgi:hypothetical protein
LARRFWNAAADKEQDAELVLSNPLGVWNGDYYPDDRIPDSALADAQNIIPGTWKMRAGNKSEHLTSAVSASAITGLHSYQPHSATPQVIYSSNGAVYRDNGTSLEFGLTNNNFEFVTYLDRVYYVNGDNSLRSWDGSAAGAVSPYTPGAGEDANYLADGANAIHDSKYIAVHEHVVYTAAPAAHPYRVYRSDEVVGATYFHHYVDVVSGFGGKIVGIKSWRGSLIILKEDSIWAADGLVGDASFTLRQLHASIGCASGRTAVDVPALGLVFLGRDGHWYVLRPDLVNNENVPLYRLSSHITDWVEGLNKSYLSLAAAHIYDDIYICTVATGSSTANDTSYAFDTTRVELIDKDPTALWVPWTQYTEPATASCYTEHRTGSNVYNLWGTTTTGMVYRLNTGTSDNGTLIDATFEMKNFGYGYSNRMKTQSTIHIMGKREAGETLLKSFVSVDDDSYTPLDTTDLSGSDVVWDAGTWDVGTWDAARQGYQSHRIYVNASGQQFQYKFQLNTLDKSFDITEVRLRYQVGEVR